MYFVLSLLGFTSILLTIKMIRFANLIVNKGVQFSQIAQVFLAIIPTFLEFAIPMAALLGVMMAFARLSGDSELIVTRASGISLINLIRPVLIFGALATACCFVVSHALKPWGYRKLSQVLFEIARSKSTSGLSEGVFNALGQVTLYAEKINYSTGALQNILIEDRRDNEVRKVIVARRGLISSDSVAQTISFHLSDGEIHEQAGQRYTLTHFISNALVFQADELIDVQSDKKETPPDEQDTADLRSGIDATNAARPLEVELSAFIGPPLPASMTAHAELKKTEAKAEFKSWRKRLSKLKIELGRRFSMPFAALLLALVALPLGIVPPRTQKTYGIGLSIALGAGIFVIYYGILSICFTISETRPAFIAVSLWLPNLVVAGIAAYTLWRIGTERWHSVAEAIGSSFQNSLRFLRNKLSR